MSSDNSQLPKKIALAAAVGVGAIGLGYLISKKLNKKPMKSEDLKQLGNAYFSDKKYAEAVEAFTEAIQKCQDKHLMSICYQNRAAAKERVGSYSSQDMLEDCNKAIECNPEYGKAFWRKARLLFQLQEWKESLTSVFCASHLDANFSKDATGILYKILEHLESVYRAEWTNTTKKGSKKIIRHERVYTWLYKTVVDDPIRSLVLGWDRKTSSQYGKALSLIADQKYDEVAEQAEKEEGENRLEALLLAARFYTYQNLKEDAQRCLGLFDEEWEKLDSVQKDIKSSLAASKHVVCLELASTKDDILKAFFNAVATNTRNPDFYCTAAFRLVLADEREEALKLLTTEGITNDNIQLLTFTLCIMNGTAGQDPASLIKTIKALEDFCNGLEKKSTFSKTLLAKVYASFGNEEAAREIMDDLIKQYPRVSILFFDRGCMGKDRDDAMEYLQRCLEIEPNHAEANLMLASLRLDNLESTLRAGDSFNLISELLLSAESTFDDSIDFPLLDGVFRMKAIIEAKRKAASLLNIH